jgi:archaellum biogenesis ATPase FlaH
MQDNKRATEAAPTQHKDTLLFSDNQICHDLDDDFNEITKDDNFGFVSAKYLYNLNVTEIKCLIEPILPSSGVIAIAGASDTGKSAFIRFLSLSIVLRMPDFLGWKINAKYNRVLFVSTEDDMNSTAFLLRKQCTNMGGDINLLDNLSFLFETDNLINKIDNMLNRTPADMVCVDCFGDLYGNDMNQNNKVRSFLNDFKQLAVKHDCLFFFLHHCGKRTEQFSPSKNNLIGSQGFEASMRLVLELRSDFSGPSMKHLCIVKGNYLPSEYKFDSYDLIFDDNLRFINTGKRTPFEQLKQVDDDKAEKYDKAITLKNQGMSLQQIADELGYKNKSSVSRLIGSVAVATTLGKSNKQQQDSNSVAPPLPQSNNEQQQSNDQTELPF